MTGSGPKTSQDAWAAKQGESNYFADNDTTFAAMKKAIGYVQPDHAYMLYNTGSVWTEKMAPALVSGKSVDDAWGAFSTELTNQAKAMGYTVK